MGATIVVDAFWGDGGKGKFCAYLAKQLNASLCVRAGTGTNAGHSVYVDGNLFKSRMVPLGSIIHNIPGLISSGVAVDPNIFLDEVSKYGLQSRAFVDRRAPLIEDWHISHETNDEQMKIIDSTRSGTGRAQADFILRRARQAKDEPKLTKFLSDGIKDINSQSKNGQVIVEGSQGTFLSLSASDRYPYVTSGNCTTTAFLDDVGLNWKLLSTVVMLVKCLPTCVGNGPLPYEMTKKRIHELGLEEFGLNTGRPKRRSKQIAWNYLKRSATLNGPTDIALTFCDQLFPEIRGKRSKNDVSIEMRRLIKKVESHCDAPVSYIGTGPEMNDVIDLT